MNATLWNRILEFNDKWFPICDAIKHMVGGGTHKVDEKTAVLDAAKEAVDVAIYLVLLLERLGCHGFEQFERVFELKMKENEQRMSERGSVK